MWQIKPCQEDDLKFLEKNFRPDFQKARYGAQKSGDGVYLIAWQNNIPVGHLMVRFFTTNNYLKDQGINIPYLEALEVKKEFRNQGIATSLMEEAEKILKSKGFTKVGLAVGVNNDNAYKLYEHLGFSEDPTIDKFLVSWILEDKFGKQITDQEMCVYMTKKMLRV